MKSSPAHNLCTETLKLLGDFWNLRIIEALAKEDLRFCALQRDLDNVNPTTLTKKLYHLEKANLIKRLETDNGHHVTYALSQRGRNSLPVLAAIKEFSQSK